MEATRRRARPGPRTCYSAARKKRERIGARERQHDEQPYTHGARAKRGPRASHTHYQHTTSATRRPAREKHTAHTPNSNLNATACLQNAPSPDRGAGDGTAFSLTATERPRDGGTVRPCGPLTYGPPVPGACAIQRPLLETQSRPETTPRAGTTRGTSSSTSNYCLKTWPPRLGRLLSYL